MFEKACERNGASRRRFTRPVASAIPLTTLKLKFDEPLVSQFDLSPQVNPMSTFSSRYLIALLSCLAMPLTALGQYDRGGDRESDRGGDRGRSGGFGGYGGGPPGGFGGGPPGGFDPSSFIERLDQNRNGMLDPEEMQGPAQFIVSRLQRDNPEIRTDKPIPISKIVKGFEKMRESRDGGGSSSDRGRDDDEARRAAEQKINDAMTVTPLVPGFGNPEENILIPLLGFGPTAELMAVEITPQDLKDAEERMRRYDRNGDGSLEGDEISSRFSGNPMDFDRNGDKKLTINELALRTARMRVVQADPAIQASRNSDKDRRDKGRDVKPVEMPNVYNGRKSYLANAARLPDGLPGWFATKDADGDGQVAMSEYASTWNGALVEEFSKFDVNSDGVVTAQECIAAVQNGVSASAMVASAASSQSSSSPSTSVATTSSSAPATGGVAGEKEMNYAQKIISRYDKNSDGALTANEWAGMLVDPSPADADKDGRVTIPEYANYMAARSKRQ